jgi:hypothetical protein
MQKLQHVIKRGVGGSINEQVSSSDNTPNLKPAGARFEFQTAHQLFYFSTSLIEYRDNVFN